MVLCQFQPTGLWEAGRNPGHRVDVRPVVPPAVDGLRRVAQDGEPSGGCQERLDELQTVTNEVLGLVHDDVLESGTLPLPGLANCGTDHLVETSGGGSASFRHDPTRVAVDRR